MIETTNPLKPKRPITEKEREFLLSLIDKIDNPPSNNLDLERKVKIRTNYWRY
tara:strand:- start:186 stop:344 length:159 start_codon:yes stop_codon:yes gene_type:complete